MPDNAIIELKLCNIDLLAISVLKPKGMDLESNGNIPLENLYIYHLLPKDQTYRKKAKKLLEKIFTDSFNLFYQLLVL